MYDNYDLWRQHEREKEEALAKLPKCSECEEHIQDDHYYEIDGYIICEKCLKDNYRKSTEDYE